MDTPDTNKIENAEDMIRILVNTDPERIVKILWTELQSTQEGYKYWQGRSDTYRDKISAQRDEYETKLANIRDELAAARADVAPAKITLMALDKAEKADRKNKIDAIKAFRDDTGLGLSESKQAVEWVWEHTQIQPCTPRVVEHVARLSDSNSQTQRVLYNTLVLDRYFGNIQDAEAFCMEVWKLLG